ncbi:MAG: hypothetical protein KDK59_05875 [Simkania sp.]|nr:hypothetical protein [Simkania sp.]
MEDSSDDQTQQELYIDENAFQCVACVTGEILLRTREEIDDYIKKHHVSSTIFANLPE